MKEMAQKQYQIKMEYYGQIKNIQKKDQMIKISEKKNELVGEQTTQFNTLLQTKISNQSDYGLQNSNGS